MKSISQKLQDDIRDIMEATLHPNQQKIDVHEPEKDKITADDFKKLRAMKKSKTEGHTPESADQVEEEEKKKIVSPFDWRNRPSELAKKPGELTGHSSKKISTGTEYTKKPVKEESHQSKTTMKHIPNPSPALKKAAKDIKPGIAGYRDRIEMLKAGGVKEAMSHQAATTMKHIPNPSPALKKAAKDIKPGIAGYRDRIAMLKAGGVQEEIEVIDELSKSTLGSYVKKAARDAVITRKISADFEHQSNRAKKPDSKAAIADDSQKYKEKSWKRRDGVDKAVDRLTKEEIEQEEYTFADYLDAARAQYDDEDAVLVANEAFKNQDITLFSDQSQSPEA
jgi:hypothetical protein